MVYFDIKLYHGGYFGYEEGAMCYIGGEIVTIEDTDSDFWCVFEALEQLTRFRYAKDNIAAMRYKDPTVNQFEIGLMMFDSDRAALDMVAVAEDRGYVELLIVHDGEQEGFPEIGYIDVGGIRRGKMAPMVVTKLPPNGENEVVDGNNVVQNAEVDGGPAEEVANEAAEGENEGTNNGREGTSGVREVSEGENQPRNEEVEAALGEKELPKDWVESAVSEAVDGSDEGQAAEGVDEGEQGDEGDGVEEHHLEQEVQNHVVPGANDDSTDGDYVPSEEDTDSADDEMFTNSEGEQVETDSADDIIFTDSESELDLEDNFFGVETNRGENGVADKRKKVVNEDFSNDDGEDSKELEAGHAVGGSGIDEAEDVDEEGSRVVYPVHKPKGNMANYRWQLDTVYASREEFKETVSSFAVHTQWGIKFDKCDRKRVIVICQPICPFRLYAVKMNEEDT
ncbi:hypothetical protein PIB30_085597 [Stylosanthes scabra]|uniref:Transposase MuDR plant domain-containing protein n=1 Tax=Stylosanthes scabra TaxID=79078 RepID=A0ABU6YQK8_9FABA|nr:hypothetical protein [Stylosanthes scabra]